MKKQYTITENIEDRPTYTGQVLTIKERLPDNYLTLVDAVGNEFFAGEEEIAPVNPKKSIQQ